MYGHQKYVYHYFIKGFNLTNYKQVFLFTKIHYIYQPNSIFKAKRLLKSQKMTIELFIRYLHFVSILTVAGSLVSEHMLLSKELSRKAIKKIATLDAIYGIASIAILITGLSMWLWIGKGADFYSKNPLLHIKVTLFVIIGLLSIKPTMFFLKNRKGEQDEIVSIPKNIFMFIRIEILILFLIPILSVLIAKGIAI